MSSNTQSFRVRVWRKSERGTVSPRFSIHFYSFVEIASGRNPLAHTHPFSGCVFVYLTKVVYLHTFSWQTFRTGSDDGSPPGVNGELRPTHNPFIVSFPPQLLGRTKPSSRSNRSIVKEPRVSLACKLGTVTVSVV